MKDLKRKYGLWTAFAMVVGIVIGSGVFFKSPLVLKETNGSLSFAIVAWIIGGLIMIFSAYSMALVSTRVEKVNGVVDYIEIAAGRRAGYYAGWYLGTIYLPIITSILAFVSADYFCMLINNNSLNLRFIIAIFLIVLYFALNILTPLLAGKFQVLATIVKLIPLFLVVLFGVFTGLISDVESVPVEPAIKATMNSSLISALLVTGFAYEGWVVATAVNAEIRNSKRNLPKALLLGTIFIVIVYVIYTLSLSAILGNNQVINAGNQAPLLAFKKIFNGNIIGEKIFLSFVVISCLGTLNGLCLGVSRSFYSFAKRNLGPSPKSFDKLYEKSNTSINSGLLAFAISSFFLLCWYFAIAKGWITGDFDELSIAFLYSSYIIIYAHIMIKFKDLNFFKRFIVPGLATLGSLTLTVGAFYRMYRNLTTGENFGQKMPFVLIITIITLIIAHIFYREEEPTTKLEDNIE